MSRSDTFRRLVRGESRGLAAWLARVGLGVASLPYRLAIAWRNARYDRGQGVEHASRPVIAVGNLTVGGTGKTPVVEWVARWFRDHGRRVCLISRGYGQSGRLNDEGLLLDQNLPDVPHLQDADRVALARIASDELEAEVLVLDDGFQHRRLARDLDLVLIDALDPFGGGRLLPAGLLREPVSSLKRAGLVILSRADLVTAEQRDWIRRQAERHAGPLTWVEGRHAPVSLVDSAGVEFPLSLVSDTPCSAFCGLGNPEGFRQTLSQLGARLAAFRTFPDHHPYDRADVESLAAWVRESGSSLVLTTQKDSVKLRLDTLGGARLLAVRIAFEPIAGHRSLESALLRILETLPAPNQAE